MVWPSVYQLYNRHAILNEGISALHESKGSLTLRSKTYFTLINHKFQNKYS